jgi:hypothetical protein
MVVWDEIRRWNGTALQEMVTRLNDEYLKLVAISDELQGSCTPDGWSGDAASAAAAAVNVLIDSAEEWSAEIVALRRSSGDVGDAITGVVNGVEEAENLAIVNNFVIAGDGAIIDNGPPIDVPAAQAEAVSGERERVAAELADRVEQTIRAAVDIDDDYCAVLDRILSGQVIDAGSNDNQQTSLAAAGNAGATIGSLSILSPPPVDAGPSANAAWWASLSRVQQERLIADHPGLVGNRDGVAAWARSEANLALVDRERARLLDERTRLMHDTPDDPRSDEALPGHIRDRLDQLNSKLDALDAVDSMMHDEHGQVRPDRQLLSLDMSGDHAKAAVANGDVDVAEHVAVFTPGMGSAVEKNLDNYVNDMDSIQRRSEDLQRTYGDGSSVAIVTWLGYEPPDVAAPDSYADIVTGDAAVDGAEKLARFNEGIDASRIDNPHLTALGHSYGSTTTGIALQAGTGVDDVVFFGSPGISDSWELGNTAADLSVPAGHAYNLEAAADVVADIGRYSAGRYGNDPSEIANLQQLSTGEAVGRDGSPLASSYGHSEYTKTMPDGTDTTSKYNIAAVVGGMPELAVTRS